MSIFCYFSLSLSPSLYTREERGKPIMSLPHCRLCLCVSLSSASFSFSYSTDELNKQHNMKQLLFSFSASVDLFDASLENTFTP